MNEMDKYNRSNSNNNETMTSMTRTNITAATVIM